MEKKLSLIVPMYNAEQYIGRCLESLLKQDIPEGEYEILIIDDGSKDGSAQIVSIYQQNNPHIYYFYQENNGQSSARNRGIEEAKGEYLWFVDADDFILQNSIGFLYLNAKREELDLLTFSMKRVENGDSISTKDFSIEYLTVLNGEEYISQNNYNNGPCYYFVKRQYLLNNYLTFIEGRFCEDGMFTLQTIMLANRIAHYPIEAYFYFVNPNSTTQRKDSAHYIKLINDFRYTVDFFEQFISSYKKTCSNKDCLIRIQTRKDSYVFFVLARLIKSTLSYHQIMDAYTSLKKDNHLPLNYFIGKDYNGIYLKGLTVIFNKRILFSLLVLLSRLKYKK